ncbi:hypothetical protein OC846_002030 [Tilletia horrida]|uniref:PFU domain-containing protein n=1 Tax=Tilletia horrida TaxID=155126 RepID=A0AAN6GSR1_9BASI|nr:hypothetical protein OC845_004311 [Tilletia horrida]KAK0554554.1 hypothetical protein OC846_002030 [Tilletia horrida]KAK0568242.1 hypothetical protein OC861_002106 [Tilletia horrida]
MSGAFQLSVQLQGHEGDVRSVAAHTASGRALVLSGSRDCTARLWPAEGPRSRAFEQPTVLTSHGGYVNATAFFEDSEGNSLSGGKDSVINAFDVKIDVKGNVKVLEKPTMSLIGHSDNICALSTIKGTIASGSWDSTARIWKDWACVAELKGHTNAVWAVLLVDEERVLTGGADKTIRLWSITEHAKPVATFAGHTDAVRGLTLLSGGQSFASCGNDGIINIYSLVDLDVSKPIQPLQTLSGHTSFVYSLATLPGGAGELVSSGEDRTVRVWRDGALLQTITVPAISVWAVATLENGDIVCGSSDSVVRVFTRDAKRVAETAELQSFEQSVASQSLNKTQVGDVKKDDLPGLEALSQPGTKEGQTKMVRNGDIVEAHQWDAGVGRWNKIGEVVGGVGSGSKKLYEGKEYDYVFEVDIADGVPPLKLPYNLSENPYTAAAKFLEKNELPQAYIDQVVKFIEKNTEAVSIGASDYVDPYTGGSRYTGGGASSTPARAPAPAPSALSGGQYTGMNNVDPFTQSSRSAASASSTSIIPLKNPLNFTQINYAPLKAKLAQLQEQSNTSPDAYKSVVDLIAVLESSSAASKTLDVKGVQATLQAWPAPSRFPLLDVLRIASLNQLSSSADGVASSALEAAQWSEAWPEGDAAAAKVRDTNSMLALRVIANLLAGKANKDGLEAHGDSILEQLRSSSYSNLGKNGRVALATILLNFSVLIVNKSQPTTYASSLLDSIVDILSKESGEAEVIYRTNVTLGNLLVSKSATQLSSESVSLAKEMVSQWSDTMQEGRFSDLKKEILSKALV